jgi:hypothetical protein
MKVGARIAVFSLSVLFTPAVSHAQWLFEGAALCTAAGDQLVPLAVSDGTDGAIVVWRDWRNGNLDLFAQRINVFGKRQWTADGVSVVTMADEQNYQTITADGFGGAIITWQDYRTGGGNADIYVQRLNASGSPLWTVNGVAIATGASGAYSSTIAADGTGGAFITWYDDRNGVAYDVFAQRVNSAGVVQWTTNGVTIATTTGEQDNPTIIADGSGGAIITWYDYRTGPTSDIYVQRVNGSGVPQWTANGVALCTAINDQTFPLLVTDGAGGAMVTWTDFRAGAYDIYARRVNSAGVPQWVSNGVAMCAAAGAQIFPAIVSDNAGGAVVAWMDNRSGNYDIYAQRVNGSGVVQWAANGVALAATAMAEELPSIASDGAGGAVVVWRQETATFGWDIWGQRVSGAGANLWGANGTGVGYIFGTQWNPTVVSNSGGGALVAWHDERAGLNGDIYAQRIEPRHAFYGHPEPHITSVTDVVGDQGGKVEINWIASGYDVLHYMSISHYSVWRATDPIAAAEMIAKEPSLLVDGSDLTANWNGPAFRVDQSPTADYYWELVGTQGAEYFAGYSFAAGTRADSTSQNPATHYFQVIAHSEYDETIFWPSNTVSGHSADNLSPAAPTLLSAQRAGDDVHLSWNRTKAPDLAHYTVYRAGASGVSPVPVNFVSITDDTLAVDANAPASELYYIVTVYDVHANQSPPSNEVTVAAANNDRPPSIARLAVLDNIPNPFHATTTLRVGLPGVSDVSIDVYDVAGRLVRSQNAANLAPGWHDVPFDGRDAAGNVLPSGVYFYRVRAAGETIVRKMVLVR